MNQVGKRSNSGCVCQIENYERNGHFLRACLTPEMIHSAGEQIDLALACERSDERRARLDGIENRLREEAHVTFLLSKKRNTKVHPTLRGAHEKPATKPE